MLKKLLYYEYRALYRTFLTLLVLLGITAVLGTATGILLNSVSPEHVLAYGSLLMLAVLFWLVPAILCLVAELMVYYRFYASCFSDEGYLTFMLPVRRSRLLFGKMLFGVLSSFFFLAVSAVAYLLMLGIPMLLSSEGFIGSLAEFFGLILDATATSGGVLGGVNAALGILLWLVESVSTLILGYTAIVIGSLYMKRHKLLGSVLFAVLIFFGVSIISTIVGTLLSPVYLSVGISHYELYAMIATLVDLCLYLGVGIGCYFLSRHMLEKNLNLS